MTTDILTRVGLTPEQADLYQSLLTHGPQTATSLSKTTKIGRTYIYRVGQELTKKGLIRMERKEHKTRFFPLSPDFLTTQAEEQKTKAQEAQIALESILPELKMKYSAAEDRPTVTYFEGMEGIKKIYLDTIKDKNPILALLEPGQIDPEITTWLDTQYIPKRIANKIPVQAIVSQGTATKPYIERNEQELRETKIIRTKTKHFPQEINIYGSKVALITHTNGQKKLGIIIDNPIIAETFKSWFDLTWEA